MNSHPIARSFIEEDTGQATLEYAIVLAAFLAMALVVSILFKSAQAGAFSQLAQKNLPNSYESWGDVGAWQDILAT